MSDNPPKALLLRNPDFRRIWLGQTLSQSGIRMVQIAWMWWLVNRGPHAGTSASIFLVMSALPSLLLVNRIGRTVDRAAPSSLLPRCDFLAAGTLAFAATAISLGWLSLPILCLISLALATIQAHFDPTLQKSVSAVTDPSDLEPAVALLASTQQLANFGGAVFGAVLVDRLGILGVTLLAMGGYAASGLLIRGASFREIAVAASTPEPSQASSPVAAPSSAWELLGQFPLIRKILVAFGITNFFSPSILVIMPLYVRSVIHGNATQLGLLEAALWLGLLAGTLTAGRVRLPGGTLATGAACLALFGLCMLVPAAGVPLSGYAAALAVGGFAMGTNNVKFITLFQESVPDELKGRFFAALQAAIGFAMPAGYFAFGLLCDRLDPRAASLIQSLGILIVSTYFIFLARLPAEACAGGAG